MFSYSKKIFLLLYQSTNTEQEEIINSAIELTCLNNEGKQKGKMVGQFEMLGYLHTYKLGRIGCHTFNHG